MMAQAEHRLAFTTPIFEPLPAQYYVRCAWPRRACLHRQSMYTLGPFPATS